ncbi:hypothetical protein [Streptosporangium saharense]|uniref:hypothetical protein n=1 Tax=Streptosporangium saharense TaxID=1706840 RepID=UPI00369390F7
MTESPEHQFLSQSFLEVLNNFSASKLYGYKEAQRRRFDFSCVLAENWDYLLDGQTLWQHTEGIDKDLRTLLLSSDAHILAYTLRDTMKNRRLLHEVTTDFRSGNMAHNLDRLKVFLIPANFDADSEDDRRLIFNQLSEQISEDILFNIIFGRISSERIRFLLQEMGKHTGLEIAVLHYIATSGHWTMTDLRRRFSVGIETVRDRMRRLQIAGLLDYSAKGFPPYYVSSAGRTFLRLCADVATEFFGGLPAQIPRSSGLLELLGMKAWVIEGKEITNGLRGLEDSTPEAMYASFAFRAVIAKMLFGTDWNSLGFIIDTREKKIWTRRYQR